MKFISKRWLGTFLGVAVFLAAFGIAFAVWIQVSQTVPSQVSVRATTVISGGNIALWHDIAMTQPVTGDPALRWGVVFTQPPLRRVDLNSERSLYIQNTSQYWLIPIDPCRRLIRSTDNGDIGFIHADMWNLSGEYRGDTCNDIRLRFELG